MKYLKMFENFPGEGMSGHIKNGVISTTSPVDVKKTIYDKNWEKLLPEKMKIYYHGKSYSFKKGNIMLLSDLVEICYDSDPENPWGCPDLLEFDIYFVKNENDDDNNKLSITVDITYGDAMACEFTIDTPNKVNVIQYTSYHSKYDPSDTVFALEDESLDSFINFLNKFEGVKLTRKEMKFLDKRDNYVPKLFPDDVHDMNIVNNANDNSNK